jgi:hypothetical protein
VSTAALAAAGHHPFGRAVTWPVLVARRDATAHNIATMAGQPKPFASAILPPSCR